MATAKKLPSGNYRVRVYDKITDKYETIVVTRKDNKNIVMLSEETYNNLLENIHLIENKENYDWLMESKAQLENGEFFTKDPTKININE